MLAEIVDRYLKKYPGERPGLSVLLGQIEAEENLQSRRNFIGHAVGTAIILSPDHKQVLLIYHPTFSEWQQPGGHWDENEVGPWAAAEREAVEETGVELNKRLSLSSDWRDPILIESHVVPESVKKDEPRHRHHAFWYAFEAKSKGIKLQDEVIKEAKWVNLDKVVKPQVLTVLERIKHAKG